MKTEFAPDAAAPEQDRAPATSPLPGRPFRSRVKSVFKHLGVITIALIMIYPVIWLLVASLRPEDLVFRDLNIVLSDLSLDNYVFGWNALQHPFSHYMINTAILAFGAIIGNLFSCSLAAYAFARIKFSGKKIMFAVMLSTIMLPIHVVIVPQYIAWSKIGFVNTFIPLLAPKFLAVDAFFIFLMVQFLRGLPSELDEAARIDGAGHFRTFTRILLPLMIPALATTAIFTFIWTWSDFFSQLIFLTSTDNYTVSLALRAFLDASSTSSWGGMFAMSIVSLIPLFLVFLLGQRYLIRGFATTGIK